MLLRSLEGIVARVKDGSFSPRGIKDELLLSDQTTLLDDCNTHVSSKIATSTNWLKIWDTTIDFGQRGTKAIQSLFKEMTRPVFGSIPCSLCDQLIPESTPYFDHYVNEHIQGQEMTKEDIEKTLTSPSLDLAPIITLFSTMPT